jgi:hypothetical protein
MPDASTPLRPRPLPPSLGASRNLVVVRAGRSSLHPGWRDAGSCATFDLLAARYEPGPSMPDAPGIAEVDIPGRKVAGYATLFRQYPDLLDRYDFIALFDDDLRATQADLERLFQIGAGYGLDLFQPSLSWSSHFTYAATLHNPRYLLRYTNMVEMMCPVFRAIHLRRALPLFDCSFETGIDLLWCRLTDAPRFRYAIVDAVSVTHTRPVGSTKHRQGFRQGETYDSQIDALLDRFDARFRGTVTYAAILVDDRRVTSRLSIALRSSTLWRAWGATPMRKLHFARFLTDYARHCLFRPLDLGQVDLRRGLQASARTGILSETRR